MRIVNREEFFKLPPYTLYVEYRPHFGFSETRIKLETIFKERDGVRVPFDWELQEVSDTAEIQLRDATAMADPAELLLSSGEDIPLNFTEAERDQSYDSEQLFGIYSEADVQGLIAQLQLCVKNEKV